MIIEDPDSHRDNKLSIKTDCIPYRGQISVSLCKRSPLTILLFVLKMARFEIFAVGLALAVAFNFVACSSDQIQTEIKVVENMDKYLEENPGLEVQPLIKEIKENGPSQYFAITYRLGYRIAGKSFEFDFPANRSTYRVY